MEATIEKTNETDDQVQQPVEIPTHTRVVIPPHAWLHEMVDKECSRYALVAIKFDFVGARVLATDGRIAASASVPELKDIASDSVMLHVESFERAVRYINRETRSLDLVLVRDNRPITGDRVRWSFEVQNSIGAVQASFPGEFVEGRFPNMDQVVTPIDPETPKATLNPLLIRRMSNVFQRIPCEISSRGGDVLLDIFSHPFTSTPWRFRASGMDDKSRVVSTDFVIMPMAPDRVEANHPDDPTAITPPIHTGTVAFLDLGELGSVAVMFDDEPAAITWALDQVRDINPELYFAAVGVLASGEGEVTKPRIMDALQSRLPVDWTVRLTTVTTKASAGQQLRKPEVTNQG